MLLNITEYSPNDITLDHAEISVILELVVVESASLSIELRRRTQQYNKSLTILEI